MSKINVLTQDVYNRIAAGEVVDGPYSVVKELVENAIDAGASEIEVFVEKAGKELIRVIDNGTGIDKDDLPKAFLAHATSKIAKAADLDSIKTLGFRGEALASIASVSNCEIISATKGNEAYSIRADGQSIGNVMPNVRDVGTEIIVKNLFFNTPVRAKFLRSDKKEEGEITSFMTRFILCNPEIAFKYYVDGKMKFQSFGDGLEEAVAQVYGATTVSQCFRICALKNNIQVHGFIGSQNFFKPNKSYQSVFLNGRCIVNNCIQTAISCAYQYYTMKRQYPFYVLFVDVPSDFVDVNVHPNKSDVRFVDTDLVFGTIYKIISSILDGTSNAADFVIDSTRLPSVKSTYTGKQTCVVSGGKTEINERKFDELYDKVSDVPQYVESKKNLAGVGKNEVETHRIAVDGKNDEIGKQSSNESGIERINKQSGEIFRESRDTVSSSKNDVFSVDNHVANNSNIVSSVSILTGDNDFSLVIQSESEKIIPKETVSNDFVYRDVQQSMILSDSKYVGTLFNTYLIYELDTDAYIIDQHAAHERLLFDELTLKIKNRSVMRQGMLIPYVLTTSVAETEFISDNLDVVREIGFDIEPFGNNSFKINEVPQDLMDIDLKAFFDELLSDMSSLKSISLEDILRDKIAMTACKHAIKGGNILTREETQRLFEMLRGNMGLKCPHGRPICVKLTRVQLDKMFKRIV